MRKKYTYLDKDGLSGRMEITTAAPMSGRSSARYHLYTNGWLTYFNDNFDRCVAFVKEETARMGYQIIGENE